MTTVNSLTVFLLIGNLQIEITADFWENLGIQYWSIESDYCVQHSLSERAIYSNPRCVSGCITRRHLHRVTGTFHRTNFTQTIIKFIEKYGVYNH